MSISKSATPLEKGCESVAFHTLSFISKHLLFIAEDAVDAGGYFCIHSSAGASLAFKACTDQPPKHRKSNHNKYSTIWQNLLKTNGTEVQRVW